MLSSRRVEAARVSDPVLPRSTGNDVELLRFPKPRIRMHFRRCRIYILMCGARVGSMRQRGAHDPRKGELGLESHVAGLRCRVALTF